MTMRIHGDKIEFPDGTEQFTASSGGDAVAQPPVAFRAVKTEKQIIPTATATKITWQDVDYNDENGFSITDNEFVVPKDGVYYFESSIGESPETTETIASLWIYVDGDRKAMSQGRQTKPHFNIYSVTAQLKLEAGQRVSIHFQIDTPSFTCSANNWSNSFSGHMVSSITEGSGGGDYTPEKMVWEDVKADRALNTVYTNTQDVPLYVQVALTPKDGGESGRGQVWIDGKQFTGAKVSMDSSFCVIPSGSTYEVREISSSSILQWHEARMPVAVGTGGDSIWTEEDGKAVYDGKVVTKGGSMHVLEPSVSGIVLRQLGGVNRIDSYDDPITTEHPLHLMADGFTFQGKGGPELMTIASDGRVDIIGSLYVNGTPKSLDVMVTDLEKDVKLKDKLIEKLSERLDELEKKLKK